MTETGYLRHIDQCNPAINERFVPWFIDRQVAGWIRPSLIKCLRKYPAVFDIRDDCVKLANDLDDFQSRSVALTDIGKDLARRNLITPPMGELYPVTPGTREETLCVMDRAVAAYFGVRAFGQHLNAYVRKRDGLHMWLGRRAKDRLIYPGRLDNMVAGGLPWGIGLEENLYKECAEEANLKPALAAKAVSVGLVSYNRVAKRGYRPDILYCYDLELSPQFKPQNTDGEVESFLLLPIEEVARLVRETDEFKLNCNLVIIDFLLRHGYITPQHDEYLDLAIGLRRSLGEGLNLSR
jgi:8-oxo-dGTP pyrophosphatase MutT (NUDIX family)